MATVDYFERKLDDKRRLTIPAELRSEFADGVVITRGFRNYLHMYSRSVWEEKVEGALKGDILDERIADSYVSYDSTLPEPIRGREAIKNEITLAAFEYS
jgi:hypothetical protein